MNILITGGTGFISSHLVSALLERDHHVIALSRSGEFAFPIADHVSVNALKVVRGSIVDRDLLVPLLKDVEVVIHNASAVGAQGIYQSSDEYIDTNIGGTSSLASVLSNEQHSVKQIILGSSISVYGEGNYLCVNCGIVRPAVRRRNSWDANCGWNPRCPICHDEILPSDTPEDAALNGEHLYATTKKCQEDLLSLAAHSAEIPLTIFRYATVYGPGQRKRNPYMQMLEKISAGICPEISEDGLQTRDFVEVGDIVSANLQALETPANAVKAFNVGSRTPVCIIDFVRQMASAWASATDTEPVNPIALGNHLPGDIRHCNIDCESVADTLGFHARVTVQGGIERLIAWYLQEKNSRNRLASTFARLRA